MPRKYNGSLSNNFLKSLGDTIANETRKEIKRGLTEAIDDLPDNQVKEQLSKNLNKQFENTKVKAEIEIEPKIKDTKSVEQKTKAFIKNAVEGTKIEIDTSDVKKDADKAADSVVNAQEKIQKEIEQTNRVIKNQQDWLKSLSVLEKDFTTSGKKEATDQLRNAYNRLAEFYRNEKDIKSYDKAYPEQRAIYDWYNSYEEAKRQGIAQSSLSRYWSASATGGYKEANTQLQEAWAYRQKVLTEESQKLQELEKEYQKLTKTIDDTAQSQDKAQQESHETKNAIEKETESHNTNADAIRDENNARKETEDLIDHGYLRKEAGTEEDVQTRRYTEKINDFITKSVSPYYDKEGQLQQSVSYLWDYDKALISISALDEKIIKQIHDIKGATEAEAAPMLTNLHILESQRKEAEDWIKKMVDSPTSNANESQLEEIERVRSAQREQLQAQLRIKDAKAETARIAKEEAQAEKEAAEQNEKLDNAQRQSIVDMYRIEELEYQQKLAAYKEYGSSQLDEIIAQEKEHAAWLDEEAKKQEESNALLAKQLDEAEQLYAFEKSMDYANTLAEEEADYFKKRSEYAEYGKQQEEEYIARAKELNQVFEERDRKKAKEYEDIFYGADGKLRNAGIAPNVEALANSNALYDELESKVKRVYDLQEASLKVDKDTLVGQDKIVKNDTEIAELKKRIVSITEEINAAEAVQEEREQKLLQIHNERDEVLKDILRQQELQSRDDMASSVSKWIEDIDKLQLSQKYTDDFLASLRETKQSLESFSSASGSIEEVTEAFNRLESSMKMINAQKGLSEFKKAQSASIAKLNLQIEEFLRKNTRMGRDFEEKFNSLKLEWDTSTSTKRIQELVAEFAKLKAEVTAADKLGAGFFETLRQRAMGVNAQLIAQYLSWQDMLRYMRQAIDLVKELDYELIDLKKTTTMSSDELRDFYFAANDTAKEMGVTTKEIISQAAAWSRLGYSSKEAATEMSALSSQFAQISPGMDVDTATDGLVSTMKAFHVDVANVEAEIMDVINKTGNTMATSNEEIVDMLERSSAAMAAANNSIKETIALESAAVQITRNAESTGTAFRTISMRIRGYDEETEEYIGGVEELTGKIADLTKTASNPKGISLFTDETKTTYKSTYQILKDISEIYNDLSDANQAELLENLAGKRGGQVLAGILEDFSEVERAMSNMQKAAGSADAEMSIVEESIDYKLNRLEQTWVGIIQELIDNGMLGKLIDGLTAISEILGEIITTIGPLPTIIAGLGIRELILHMESIPKIASQIWALVDAAEAASKVVTFENATESTAEVLLNLEGIEGVFGKITDSAEEATQEVGKIGKVAGSSGVAGASKLATAFRALVPILTNPLTIMLSLAAATYALYRWVDGANDRQREKISSLQKEFNELDNQLNSTNSELTNVEKQIEEIQSKGTISLVEQQELERLRTQAELLKIARQEQEELLKLKAQELTDENTKHFNKVYGDISSNEITNPEERLRGNAFTVGNRTMFSYGENLSSALESASKGNYNDSPNELLAIYQQIQSAREGALKTIKEYENANRELNEEEAAALEGAHLVIQDTYKYMSGLTIQIGKVKTELLSMKQDAERAGTEDSKALLADVDNALKLVYEYSGTSKEWNAMQIDSIFDNSELEVSRQELEAIAKAGELSEDTLKRYPQLSKDISGLNLILGDGETAFGLFKNELLASAEAAEEVDNELSNALDSAKSWESERNEALKKLGLLKESSTGDLTYDESWSKYLETIKALNPEIAENEKEVEKCALANLQFSKAIEDLSKNFTTYKEALKDADTLTPEYSDAINALADDLTYLTGINFSIEQASDFLGTADNLELLEKALNGSDEALQQLQAHANEGVKINVDVASVEELRNLTTNALADVKNELQQLSQGGSVDLTIRPKVDTHFLRDVGWEDAAGEYATVFTQTFTNKTKDIAVNFTPIIVDENGNFVDVMEPDALTEYAEAVIAGTRTDDLNLQIGAEFTGEDAVEQAEAAARRIHDLHQLQIELGLDTDTFNAEFNAFVDWLSTADLGTLEAQTYLNEDPFIQGLVNLAKESKEMADKIQKIFADLGWNITWDTTKMKVPKAGGSQITSIYAPSEVRSKYSNAGSGAVRWEYEEMDVPTNIHFERLSSGSSRRTPTSSYTPKSLSPAQKSTAKQNIDKANGSGSDKTDDYKEFIDYFERMIKVLDNSVDLLEAHLEDVVGSFAKNTLLDAEEDLIQSKMNGYSSAIDMYSQKASEALSKIPSDIAEKIQNGAVDIDEFIGESNKDVVEAIQEYEKWADKVQDCKLQLVQLKEAIRQLELDKFNNVMQDFTDQFDLRQSAGIDLISKQIDLLQEAGELIGESFYKRQQEQAQKQLQILTREQEALVNQLNEALSKGVNITAPCYSNVA